LSQGGQKGPDKEGGYVGALELRGETLEAEDEEGVDEHDREDTQKFILTHFGYV